MGHLRNARYAHLDRDLSSSISDFTGRHPLPNFVELVNKLGQWGVSNNSQIVVYDDSAGAFAARLWWLLRYLGHEAVAVLNGGVQHWRQLGYPLTTCLPTPEQRLFRPYPSLSDWINALDVENGLAKKSICLVDARTSERFQGKSEPIDPVAGHIPGAINRPFQTNLNNDGLFLSSEQLRSQFLQLTGDKSPKQIVHMCGSGVTACHNVLAMEYCGLAGSKLYPGSWSEWIRNKNRAVVNPYHINLSNDINRS
jgi:thiosulfate/3-mercaptopyruvate sulfurtransferase